MRASIKQSIAAGLASIYILGSAVAAEMTGAEIQSLISGKTGYVQTGATASVLAFHRDRVGIFREILPGSCCLRSLRHFSSSMLFRGGARLSPSCGV